MGIGPCVTGPVERYEVGNKKELTKSPLPYIYTWWEFAPEDYRAENPVTTVTVFDSFSLFTAENNLARGVGLEKVTPVIFSGCGAVFSEALGRAVTTVVRGCAETAVVMLGERCCV